MGEIWTNHQFIGGLNIYVQSFFFPYETCNLIIYESMKMFNNQDKLLLVISRKMSEERSYVPLTFELLHR
jgi:hypothetical protein